MLEHDQYEKLREKLIKRLKKKQSEKRFMHTLNVEKTAIELAKIHGADEVRVSLAALLHDYAKNYPTEKKERLCEKYSIILSELEHENMDLAHSKLGAAIAKAKYDIEDEDVINAILFHTTGRPHMSLIEKIIYISDFIEPGRKEFPGLIKARKLAYEDIDKSLIKVLLLSINHLVDQEKPIDPVTEQAYEYYYQRYNEKVV
jgi:predicted HD superfamily hydrolase involved in NAD metabolism